VSDQPSNSLSSRLEALESKMHEAATHTSGIFAQVVEHVRQIESLRSACRADDQRIVELERLVSELRAERLVEQGLAKARRAAEAATGLYADIAELELPTAGDYDQLMTCHDCAGWMEPASTGLNVDGLTRCPECDGKAAMARKAPPPIGRRVVVPWVQRRFGKVVGHTGGMVAVEMPGGVVELYEAADVEEVG